MNHLKTLERRLKNSKVGTVLWTGQFPDGVLTTGTKYRLIRDRGPSAGVQYWDTLYNKWWYATNSYDNNSEFADAIFTEILFPKEEHVKSR